MTATEQLEQVWSSRPGLIGWLATVNHKAIGRRYIVTATVFFAAAGILALVMRLQLAAPEADVLGPDAYNQIFTMHGTTMMFLFAVPMMEGIGIYFLPLLIGTRDLAFPKLNALGYFVYLTSGVALFYSFFAGQAPDGGWFNYLPLTGPEYSPRRNIDFYATMITFLEIAALVAAAELVVTAARQRAPGMTLRRMPVFVWAQVVMSMMIIFAMPPLVVASVMLALDRMIGTSFFDPGAGGDPLLWQHLFWFFGHPEVYIILIPALGIVSMIIPALCGRRLIGYTPIVASIVAIGILSFGLWVHHMFAAGLPLLGMSFFVAASMAIAVPSGIQIFAWIATLGAGRPRLNAPLLYVIGFVVIFVLGGITGVMVAALPFDLQAHDTFFVVAHFHYVLIGGGIFPLLGALHYWFPKVTGKLMSDRLGKVSFWLIFGSFNATFFPMHITGLLGMPRRVYTYQEGLGWDGLNMLSTVASIALGIGLLLELVNTVTSARRGRPAGDNPWGGGSLEWTVSSPPPIYNFRHIPIVDDENPAWVPVTQDASDYGMRDDRRETLGTTMLDAVPEQRIELPGPTLWPLALALSIGITFAGAIYSLVFVPIGAVLAFASFVGWFWPRHDP